MLGSNGPPRSLTGRFQRRADISGMRMRLNKLERERETECCLQGGSLCVVGGVRCCSSHCVSSSPRSFQLAGVGFVRRLPWLLGWSLVRRGLNCGSWAAGEQRGAVVGLAVVSPPLHVRSPVGGSRMVEVCGGRHQNARHGAVMRSRSGKPSSADFCIRGCSVESSACRGFVWHGQLISIRSPCTSRILIKHGCARYPVAVHPLSRLHGWNSGVAGRARVRSDARF